MRVPGRPPRRVRRSGSSSAASFAGGASARRALGRRWRRARGGRRGRRRECGCRRRGASRRPGRGRRGSRRGVVRSFRPGFVAPMPRARRRGRRGGTERARRTHHVLAGGGGMSRRAAHEQDRERGGAYRAEQGGTPGQPTQAAQVFVPVGLRVGGPDAVVEGRFAGLGVAELRPVRRLVSLIAVFVGHKDHHSGSCVKGPSRTVQKALPVWPGRAGSGRPASGWRAQARVRRAQVRALATAPRPYRVAPGRAWSGGLPARSRGDSPTVFDTGRGARYVG